MNKLLERISIDPAVCGGKPCIKGTRIWVSLILDFLADGMTEAELLVQYPQLVHENVLAAIAYGAEVARERVLPVPDRAGRVGSSSPLSRHLQRRNGIDLRPELPEGALQIVSPLQIEPEIGAVAAQLPEA